MKKSIKNKLLFMVTLSLGVSVALSFLINEFYLSKFYLNHTEKRMIEIVLKVEQNLDKRDFMKILFDLDRQEQVNVIVVDDDLERAILSHNFFQEEHQLLERELREILKAELQNLEKSYICKMVSSDSQPDRLIFIKKMYNGQYCILTAPIAPLESSINAMSSFHILTGGFAGAVGLIITILLSKQFIKPIVEISEVTNSMAEMNFSKKIVYQSQDELGSLAKSINVLSHKLEENEKALIKEIEFQKILSQNMSHELKTPIAVIKGYLEALSYGVIEKEEEKEEYLKIVLDECEQMTSLINEMLKLSRLTSIREGDLQKFGFKSSDFVKKLEKQNTSLLSQENINLEKDIQDIILFGNFELIVQGFSNFITNAIKYGDGKRIKISIYEEGDFHILSLFNTGEIINDNEREKIFNIFHMVDKSRNRKLNSHGLGLSVCKMVGELHGGKAFCKSVDGGMEFIIKIQNINKFH